MWQWSRNVWASHPVHQPNGHFITRRPCSSARSCFRWPAFKVNYKLKQHHWYGFVQYIPRNMHTVFAVLCFVVVIHWLIFPYPSGLLHWHCGNLTDKYLMWIHYERLHNHNKAKHNKTVCIFLGIYCRWVYGVVDLEIKHTMEYATRQHRIVRLRA